MKKKLISPLIVIFILLLPSTNLSAQEAFIGEVRLVAFNFVPRGWADCNGQLLPISQNAALFSLLGTTYGGDGRTTFAVPDLRGRVVVGAGQAPGQKDVRQGARFGNGMEMVNTMEGRSKANTIVQPSTALRFVICVNGIFPSRN